MLINAMHQNLERALTPEPHILEQNVVIMTPFEIKNAKKWSTIHENYDGESWALKFKKTYILRLVT